MFGPVSERIGEPKTWPQDPDAILALLDQLFQKNLMEEDPAKRISVGMIFDHAQYLMPTSELSQMAGPQGSRLVRLLSWAQNPYIKRQQHRHLPALRPARPRSTSGWSAARTSPRWKSRCPTPLRGRPSRPGSTAGTAPRQPDRLHARAACRPDQRPEPGQPGTAAGAGREVGHQARRQQPQACSRRG